MRLGTTADWDSGTDGLHFRVVNHTCGRVVNHNCERCEIKLEADSED